MLQVPPSSHFIFIPVVLVLGIIIGFMLGARATRDAIATEARRRAELSKQPPEWLEQLGARAGRAGPARRPRPRGPPARRARGAPGGARSRGRCDRRDGARQGRLTL